MKKSPLALFALFSAEFLFYVSGYIVHMVAGRALGPEDYGRYGLVLTATLLIANLVGSGIPIAMSKFLSESAENDPGRLPTVKRESARAQIILMTLVTAAFFLLAPVFAAVLGDPSLTPLFRIAAFIIPAYAADLFYFYLFSGMQRLAVQSGLKLARALLRIIVISAFAYLFHLEGVLTAYILVPCGVLAVAVLIDLFAPALGGNGSLRPEAKRPFHIRSVFALALPVTLFLFLFEILISFDIYILKYLFGSDELAGQYNAALTVARVPSFLFYALTLILLPSISESHARADLARMRETLRLALRFMLIIAFPFVGFIAAYPESILTLLFGGEYAPAAVFLPVLAGAASLLAILYVSSFAYKGVGRILVPVSFVGAGLTLNVILDCALLPIYGGRAVPWIKLGTVLLLVPFFLRSIHQMFDTRLSLSDAIKLAIVTGIVYLLARATGNSITSLFIFTVPLGLLFLGLITLTRVITKDDLALLRRKKV